MPPTTGPRARRLALTGLLVLVLALPACRGGDGDADTPAGSESPTEAADTGPSADPTDAGTADVDAPATAPGGLPPVSDSEFSANTEPDVETPIGGLAGYLQDIALSSGDGFDRLELILSVPEGDGGLAGWDASYVEAYLPIGEEQAPDLPGDATLQTTLRSISLPVDDLDLAFPPGTYEGPGTSILQVLVTGWFEGQQDLVIGTPSELAFRVYSDHPRRVIIEVAHPS